MSSPHARNTPSRRVTPPSPAEDGELRETLQDVIDRNKHKSPVTRGIVKKLYAYRDVLTPGAARTMGNLLSAYLEPMPDKPSPRSSK